MRWRSRREGSSARIGRCGFDTWFRSSSAVGEKRRRRSSWLENARYFAKYADGEESITFWIIKELDSAVQALLQGARPF
jgi:hypothetical protein